MFTQVTTCHKCQGKGTVIEEYCLQCKGHGTIQKVRTIELTIPKGVDAGASLRLAGEGEAGSSRGRNGDLYVVIHLQKHPRFTRQGADLHMTQEISYPEAALGTTLLIQTITGDTEKLRIPEGTQTGDILLLSRRGMSGLQGRGQGDLYVEIQVTTPKKLSRRAKELLEELNKELAKQ
jgi:molecular chaperone DnaJ